MSLFGFGSAAEIFFGTTMPTWAAAGEAEKPNQLPRQRKKRRRKYQNVETMFRIKASVFHELSISSINCSILTTTTSP